VISTLKGSVNLVRTIDKTDWNVAHFADHVKNTHPSAEGDTFVQDAILTKYFKNPHFGYIDLPVTILDGHGRIMVWYLPRILSICRIVCIFFHLISLINHQAN
jgi:hypothetical protein